MKINEHKPNLAIKNIRGFYCVTRDKIDKPYRFVVTKSNPKFVPKIVVRHDYSPFVMWQLYYQRATTVITTAGCCVV